MDKIDKHTVAVRFGPLQQADRRSAQEQICKKLTVLGAQIPTGKFMAIEVGEASI